MRKQDTHLVLIRQILGLCKHKNCTRTADITGSLSMTSECKFVSSCKRDIIYPYVGDCRQFLFVQKRKKNRAKISPCPVNAYLVYTFTISRSLAVCHYDTNRYENSWLNQFINSVIVIRQILFPCSLNPSQSSSILSASHFLAPFL